MKPVYHRLIDINNSLMKFLWQLINIMKLNEMTSFKDLLYVKRILFNTGALFPRTVTGP